MVKNARTILSEHIKVHWNEEEKIVAAMKEYANQFLDLVMEDVIRFCDDNYSYELQLQLKNFKKQIV